MMRVLIADDHPVVRQGLRRIVEESDDLRVAGEATNGDEVLDLVQHAYADVLLLDIGMPGPGVFALVTEIRKRRPRLPVLILSVYPEEQYAMRLLKLGAAGYLTKDHSPERLVEAIRRVASGRKFISPDLAETLAAQLEGGVAGPRHESLSDREYHVMVQLAGGRSVTQIARDLDLSPKTISTYRARVIKKMGFSSGADLIRYALEQDLVD